MYWINRTKNRFYSVTIARDLFGECSILKSWGGVNSKLGGGDSEPCGCTKAALLRIEEIKKERKGRGYDLIG